MRRTIRIRLLYLILLAIAGGCAVPGSASAMVLGPILIGDSKPIPPHFESWEDREANASLSDVRQLPDDRWVPVPGGSETYGITPSAYWLRVALVNTTTQRQDLIAELAYSQLDRVTFYAFADDTLLDTFRTGDTLPFYPRRVDHPNMLYRLTLPPGQSRTLYIRVQTAGSMILPFRLWHEPDFYTAAASEQKLHFFYYGALSVIILLNLAVFLILRERLYLYYSLAISGYLLFFASIKGYSFQLLYPAHPEIHARALLMSMPILALFSVLFCRSLLRIPAHSPRLDVAIRAMIAFEVVNFVASLTLSYNGAILLSSLSALVFFSLLFVAGPITWAAGVRAGAFFTVAWTPLTVGVLATAGRALGFFPENFFTENAMQIGSGMEAFILTLALADRLYREREEKIRAQAESLAQARARNEAQNRLTRAMTHDLVTGLPNRNLFETMVNEQLKQNPSGRYMVGVARMTRLDEVNRTLGLSRSDRLLQTLARNMLQLAESLPYLHRRAGDDGRQQQVYQLSRDSFGLLVDANRVNDGFESLNRVLRALAEPVWLDQLAIELHPKFGAAAYPEHGDTAAQLIRNAHVGMEITPHGPFETGLYSEAFDIYSESRLTLLADLRGALQTDQVALHYQPKQCARTGRVTGIEALIRWHHPQRGDVPPVEFIPLAEDTGVITQVTRWALARGLGDLAALSRDWPALTLAVNLSARDLLADDLAPWLQGQLAHHGIAPARLVLELTETAAMDHPEKSLSALAALSALGLRVSIDDFGSGYSSLSYLKQLPASELKLDSGLIEGIEHRDDVRVIVRTAINMAHDLGYTVVAEGVETGETAKQLVALECDTIQGFWFCRPLPLAELRDWLAARS